jgi:pimeloyl-ACP methyl ester carboxylesterase
MAYASNPVDDVRTYFEDAGGNGLPVVFFAGFSDPLEYSQATDLARELSGDFRLIFADHRGQGRSDKPREAEAYSLVTRVADVGAVLDELGIDRAHFVGFSWGARLGFAMGEHAPERLLSLVLCGNQPYEWDPGWPMARVVSEAVAALREGGIVSFVESWEASLGERFPEPIRTWMLENDAAALEAMWRSAWTEGPISRDLTKWRVPCLICVGETDDMRTNAERAAAEIPNATFLPLAGHTHYSAPDAVDELLPAVLDLFRSATPAR